MSNPVPTCCQVCKWLESDLDYWDDWYVYCGRLIWLPTKKQTCKRQKLRKEGENE